MVCSKSTSGTAIDVERSGRMAGLGNGAVGAGLAGTPGIRITTDLSEAIFAPLAARQNAKAAEAASRVVKHQTLLKVILSYYIWIGQALHANRTESRLQPVFTPQAAET